MSVLRAGNTTLEDGKVRICVPIAYETEKEILEESVRIGKSSVADIAEWRIDWYQDVFQPRKRNALAKKIREKYPNKTIWLYTGSLWEEICNEEIVQYLDVCVDGEFQIDKRDTSLRWKGSSNQRVIDVPSTLREGKVVLHCDN